MPQHPVIAIDGPAASGKSSVARALAARHGFAFVNSGSLYRAMAWGLIEEGVDVEDEDAVRRSCAGIDLRTGLEDGASWVAVGGQRLGGELESPEVNAAVSRSARVPAVRALVVAHLRAFAQESPLVMEGRDIGSVVFPDTPWKFYIDASEEVRQQRRAAQGQADNVRDRDRADSSRKSAPLVVPDGAVVIDSSELGIDEVVARIVAAMREAGFGPEGQS